jgi:hypothetical protein
MGIADWARLGNTTNSLVSRRGLYSMGMNPQAKKTIIDWSGCEAVEVIPGKVSGVPYPEGDASTG